MKNFTIGAWIIGEPDNFPVKLLTLNRTGINVETMCPDGTLCLSDLNKTDVLASPETIAMHLTQSFIEGGGIDIEEICHAIYDEEEDSLKVNNVTVYKDGKFIDIL